MSEYRWSVKEFPQGRNDKLLHAGCLGWLYYGSSTTLEERYYDTSPARIQLLRFLLLVRTEIAGDLVFRCVAGKFRFIAATLRRTRSRRAFTLVYMPPCSPFFRLSSHSLLSCCILITPFRRRTYVDRYVSEKITIWFILFSSRNNWLFSKRDIENLVAYLVCVLSKNGSMILL